MQITMCKHRIHYKFKSILALILVDQTFSIIGIVFCTLRVMYCLIKKVIVPSSSPIFLSCSWDWEVLSANCGEVKWLLLCSKENVKNNNYCNKYTIPQYTIHPALRIYYMDFLLTTQDGLTLKKKNPSHSCFRIACPNWLCIVHICKTVTRNFG